MPIEGTQPVYFFYNKPSSPSYHLTFPTTFSGLLSTVATLKSHGNAPISLANGDQWPGLMYLEYLTDRIGGPGVAQALAARQAEAPGPTPRSSRRSATSSSWRRPGRSRAAMTR